MIHEFAHKLDELTGAPNGLPPLHRDMSVAAWSQAMSAAYETFNDRLDRGEEPPFDDYAGTDPAEFFAVVSELFFTAPDVLQRHLSGRVRAVVRVLPPGSAWDLPDKESQSARISGPSVFNSRRRTRQSGMWWSISRSKPRPWS